MRIRSLFLIFAAEIQTSSLGKTISGEMATPVSSPEDDFEPIAIGYYPMKAPVGDNLG